MDKTKQDIIKISKANALGMSVSELEKTSSDEELGSMEKIAAFSGGMVQDPYPSPFLNLSDTQIPSTTIELFRWSKYFYTFDPLINGAINALASFPITEIYLEDLSDKTSSDESETLKTYKKVIFDKLDIYKTLIEIGIDYYLYGNCFVFGQMGKNKITGEKEWKNIVRLDPSKMIIDHNPATNEKKFKWQVPFKIREIVKRKSPREEYDKIPDIIKEAVKKNQTLVLNPENIYHFSRATDSLGDNNVWGVPIVANVIKLLMYRNTLRQAQEAIAREHIVPMRVFYVDNTNTYNADANWNNVATNLAAQLQKSVRDPNYKVVSPVPVNVINVGGEGRALMLTAEIQQIQEEILAGMNVPREFIFGGMSYSGSSISLKILENNFITYRLLIKDFLENFLIKGMAKARGEWKSPKDDDSLITVKLMDMKMQDDVQQKQLIIQLNASGKCTDEYMWKVLGLDGEKIRQGLEQEALEAIELKHKTQMKEMELQMKSMELQTQMQIKQLEQQMILQKAQMEMQQKMGMGEQPNPEEQQGAQPSQVQQPMGQPMEQPIEQQPQEQMVQQQNPVEQAKNTDSDQGSGDNAVIENFAKKLSKIPTRDRESVLSQLPRETKDKVMKALSVLETQNSTDMRPMPKERPPRRDSLK